MNPAERVFLDAGLFIGALLAGDPRHAEARGIVEAARRGELAACTSVGVLAEVYAALTWVGALPPHQPDEAAAAVRALTAAPYLWLPRSSVGASPDAPASRCLSGRWSGRGCIPTRSVRTRRLTALLLRHGIDAAEMDFPAGWEQMPIWQEAAP